MGILFSDAPVIATVEKLFFVHWNTQRKAHLEENTTVLRLRWHTIYET